MKSVKCKSCNQLNTIQNLFCGQCGARINHAAPLSGNTSSSKPERRQVSAFFANIVQSNNLILRLDPEHYDQIVRLYHSISEQLIEDYGGQITEKNADGLVAIFSSNELSTESAVRAGIELVDNINESRAFKPSMGQFMLQTRIGIASGEAIVKDYIGNKQHKIHGQPTFLAARLQTMAKAGQVLVCNDTFLKTQRFFSYINHHIAPNELKGFDNISAVWEAKAPKLMRLDYVNSNRTNLTPFTGRNSCIDTLLLRWDMTLKKQGQVTIIKASAGMGKSRLLAELYRRLKRVSPNLIGLRYHCSSFASKLPLYPAMHQITRATQIRKNDSFETVNDKLRSLIDSWGIDADSIAPVLLPLLFHSNRHKTTRTPKHDQIKAAIQVCTAIPFSYAQRAPVLVFVEDMHWADPASIKVLLNSVNRSASTNIMFVVTYRDNEFQLPKLNYDHIHDMSLKPLSDQSAMQLLDSIEANQDLSTDLKQNIIDKSAGVPLFIEELALHSYRSAQNKIPNLHIPASLFDLFIQRFDQFNPSIRSFARAAAIFGLEFDASIVSNMLEINKKSQHEIINSLIQDDQIYKIHNNSSWYQFKHALIRDAIYDNTLNQDKHSLHKSLYKQLIKSNTDDSLISFERIAHHQKMFRFYSTYAKA